MTGQDLSEETSFPRWGRAPNLQVDAGLSERGRREVCSRLALHLPVNSSASEAVASRYALEFNDEVLGVYSGTIYEAWTLRRRRNGLPSRNMPERIDNASVVANHIPLAIEDRDVEPGVVRAESRGPDHRLDLTTGEIESEGAVSRQRRSVGIYKEAVPSRQDRSPRSTHRWCPAAAQV